ncbi:MAG: AAA family ATPase, partial [Actinomycetota bacterium]
MFVRPYRDRDLPALLQLWEQTGELPGGPGLLSMDDALDLLHTEGAVCVVADEDDAILGMALGVASGPVAWVLRIGAVPGASERDFTRRLLDELEARLSEIGARKLIALVADEGMTRVQLEERSYVGARQVLCMQRGIPATLAGRSALVELGGRMVDPGLWDSLKGLQQAKEIIERRVILPLAEPQLATRHAVSPPSAIVLFGPPGTGKTTFAKGIASRVGWPFVEIQPSQLAAEGAERQAELLGQ